MVRVTDEQRDRIACEFSRRRSGVVIPAPVRTCPFESGLRAGKSRPGADDRESAGSASHRARRDGLSMHAGRLRERRSTGDAPNHCDRGQPAAAFGDRSFFYPRFQSDACSGSRTMPVPRRSGDDAPCSPERGCRAALRRRIPADCVLAGTDRVRCRTGRTSHRRLSYTFIRKERASFARAHPHKGLGARDGSRNGCRMPEVTKLKHAARGTRRPRGDPTLRDKAEQWGTEFLPIGAVPIGPIRRGNSPACRREMFHALYMPSAASEPPVVRGLDRRWRGRPVRLPIARLYCEAETRHALRVTFTGERRAARQRLTRHLTARKTARR